MIADQLGRVVTRGIDFGDFIYWAATSNHYRQLQIAAGHKSVKIGYQGERLADENVVGVVPLKSGHGHPPPLLSAEYQLGYRSCTVLYWTHSRFEKPGRPLENHGFPHSPPPGTGNAGKFSDYGVWNHLTLRAVLTYGVLPKGNIHRFPLILREDT
ncbi:hypothetical protein B9Z19DRAFT_822239 [Tuber borchii]|uniref:Uncharacterized protein n=1 Tax=Tuber borchii TaxID=42251 RepID=A0A2T7A7A6_TUBBO|nr:hypothetical protein B9Z19DRAFT_822239 [Tuber borchii]